MLQDTNVVGRLRPTPVAYRGVGTTQPLHLLIAYCDAVPAQVDVAALVLLAHDDHVGRQILDTGTRGL